MKPLVSIVVPVYNVGDYVLRCLDSLHRQSYERIELIVVDDGSTDESGRLCDDFKKKEKRARVFHKKNGGLSGARNYGIKKAKGNYICLVDSDDYVSEVFVERMVAMALKDNVDVVMCGYNNEIPKAAVLTGKEATVKLLTQQDNMEIIAWNKMYRRALFDVVDYPEGLNYEDNLTTYKLLSRAERVGYLAESLYNYVEREGSITKEDEKEKKLKFREKAALGAIEYFKGDLDLKEAAEIALLTAKLAFIDSAINGKIDKKYMDECIVWVSKHKEKLLENKYLSKKLRLYIGLITTLNAKPYIGFRKIRHE